LRSHFVRFNWLTLDPFEGVIPPDRLSASFEISSKNFIDVDILDILAAAITTHGLALLVK
jgi:hypothetical protein